MYYFIPAWYGKKERPWYRESIPWYRSTQRIEFDDAIYQLRMFQGENKSTKIVLFSYMPHLRYFLHRQDIFESDYYSIFDTIQGIADDKEMQVLQIKDLAWPEDCEFIYTPFLVIVRRNSELYAHIEFGEEGFISFIEFFKDEQLDKVYLMDDRGFISSIVYYEDGQASYQDYLNMEGEWRVREQLANASYLVEVNPMYRSDFKQSSYETMLDLIVEKFTAYFSERVEEEKKVVIAAHPIYPSSFFSLFSDQASTILSFFYERNREDDLNLMIPMMKSADLVLTDQSDMKRDLQNLLAESRGKIHQLSPFDTRLQLGKSQRRKEVKIYYQINLQEPLNDYAIFKVLFYIAQHPQTELVIGVYNAWKEGIEKVEEKVAEILTEYLNREDFVKKHDKDKWAENSLIENQTEEYRFAIKNITNELELIQELEYIRLIIDLDSQPNLYTQIAGISAGIPQINLISSNYVKHKENGYILSEIADLPNGLDYYLDGLKNWNKALIYSIDKIRENVGSELIQKWETWLEEEDHEERT